MTRKYFTSADIVRVIAIAGVVSIHVVYPVYSRFDFMGGISWWFANFANSISLVCIPFFLMISGFLLLGRDEKIPTTLSRSFFRIFLPFIIWVKLYFLWNADWHKEIFKEKQIALVLLGRVFHLYFLLILLGLYLFLPLLRVFVKRASRTEVGYLLTLAFFIGIALTYGQYRYFKDFSFLNAFSYWVPYLSYFLAGHYFANLKLSIIKKRMLWFTFFASFFATAILSYLNLRALSFGDKMWWLPGNTQYFNEFLSPNVIIMSLSLFILIMHQNNIFDRLKNKLFLKSVNLAARTSFGIYLIHLMVIDFLELKLNFAINKVFMNLSLFLIIKFALVFGISFIIIAIWRKIPILKLALGER